MDTLETIRRINRPKLTQANYERQNEGTQTMAQEPQKDLATLAASLRVPLRGLHPHLWADAGAFDEAQIHQDGAGLPGDRDSLPELPSDSRREDEPRTDALGSASRDRRSKHAQAVAKGCSEKHRRREHWVAEFLLAESAASAQRGDREREKRFNDLADDWIMHKIFQLANNGG